MKTFILKIYYKILGMMAKSYLKTTKPYVIGITGSIGKTSCRMIVSQVIKRYLKKKTVYTSPNNFNGEFGMTLSIFGIEKYQPTTMGLIKIFFNLLGQTFSPKKKYDIILLEYGIDHPGEMDFLLKIAKPHIAIVTKIDKVHSMQFTSPDIIAQEKYKLPKNAIDAAFLNIEDAYAISGKEQCKCKTFLYTTHGDVDNIDINYTNIQFEKDEGELKIKFDGLYPNDKTINIKSNLFGQENYGYLAMGLSVASQCHKHFDNQSLLRRYASNSLELSLELQNGRFNVLDGIEDSVLIDSSYNAAPASMQKIIENTLNLRNNMYPDYKIILALGDMRELGDFNEKEHRQIAGAISQVADFVVLVGESMELYGCDELQKIGFNREKMQCLRNSRKAGEYIKNILERNKENNYLVLFKGSQNTIFMEEAVKQLLINEADKDKLVRQADFWIEKKEEFFSKA